MADIQQPSMPRNSSIEGLYPYAKVWKAYGLVVSKVAEEMFFFLLIEMLEDAVGAQAHSGDISSDTQAYVAVG